MSLFCKIFWERFRDRCELHLSFATKAGSAKKSTPRCERPMPLCATPRAKNWKHRMCRLPISRICACANKSIQQKNAKRWNKELRGSAAAAYISISSMRTRRKARCTRKMCCQQLRDDEVKDDEKIGARKRTRTSTPLRELEPESSASASSAIRALLRCLSRLEPSQPALRGKFILPAATLFVNARRFAATNCMMFKLHDVPGGERCLRKS